MSKIKFYDENTRQWWTPNTGGANIPSLNDLLSPWGISLTDEVLEGEVWLGGADSVLYYASGVGIHSFPANGFVVSVQELNDQGECIVCGSICCVCVCVSICVCAILGDSISDLLSNI